MCRFLNGLTADQSTIKLEINEVRVIHSKYNRKGIIDCKCWSVSFIRMKRPFGWLSGHLSRIHFKKTIFPQNPKQMTRLISGFISGLIITLCQEIFLKQINSFIHKTIRDMHLKSYPEYS